MLATLKAYATSIMGMIVAILGILAGYYRSKANAQEMARKEAEKRLVRHKEITARDDEIEEQTRSRRTDALKELQDTGDSELYRNPNLLRKRTR